MSLKDRINNAKKTQQEIVQEKDFSEFNISVLKLLDLIRTVETPEKLGLIVKEVAKFLENFATENLTVTVSGDLDCGKQALLGCLLSGVIEEKSERLARELAQTSELVQENPEPEELLIEEPTDAQNEDVLQQPEEQNPFPQEPEQQEPAMVKKRKNLRQKLKGR